jgi:hypothetical protein
MVQPVFTIILPIIDIWAMDTRVIDIQIILTQVTDTQAYAITTERIITIENPTFITALIIFPGVMFIPMDKEQSCLEMSIIGVTRACFHH